MANILKIGEFKIKKSVYLVIFNALLASACAPHINSSDVAAKNSAPESLKVEPISIALDQNKPKYVLYVEKPTLSAEKLQNPDFKDPLAYTQNSSVKISGYNPQYTLPIQKLTKNTDEIVAEQFIGAIGNVRNFVLLDKSSDSNDKPRLEEGECGPYKVKVVISEFSENAESSDSVTEGSFSKVISLFGNQVLNTLDPSFGSKEATRTGSVTFILQVFNPNRNRMLFSETAYGTFTAKTKTSGFSVLGASSGGNAFAASALGQATQAALNDGVKKLFDKFKEVVPTVSLSCSAKIDFDKSPKKLSKRNKKRV